MGIAYRSVLKDIGTGGISVDSVTITNYPNTTTYMVGDKLNLSGLAVYAEIGSLSGDVTNDCTFTPADGDTITASTTKVTVKYGSEKLDIPLTVVTPTAITITSQPTKTNYKTNEPLDFTGLVVTASKSEAGLSANVTSACTFNPAEGTTLEEEKTYTISVSYGSLSTSFDVVCQNLPDWDSRGLNYNSWETIQAYIKEGLFNTVASVGQTKSFVINGKTYHAEVVAINDGTGSAGQYYPANTVDFVTEELYPTANRWIPRGKSNNGYGMSAAKSFIDGTIYPLVPSDLKAVILPKTHAYQTRNGSEHSTELLTTALWLPTRFEIIGTYDSGSPDETANNNKLYTIYDKTKSIVGSSTKQQWYTSTTRMLDYGTVWFVKTDGSIASGSGGGNDERYYPICFRVG